MLFFRNYLVTIREAVGHNQSLLAKEESCIEI